MRVMLVDDSRTVRNIQKNALAKLGHTEIMEAGDGIEALKLLEQSAPEIVLIDWNMPNMDGIALVRKIREANRTLPLIMCTTEAETDRVAEAMRAGVNDYLIKPFSVEALAEKIGKSTAKLAAPA